MTERDFLQAIEDDPDDVGNHLVYADWLEDQGEEDRARLIRLAVELEAARRRSSPYDEQWRQVDAQCKKVLKSWAVARKWSKHFTLGWHLGVPNSLGCHEMPSIRALNALPEIPSFTLLRTGTPPSPEALAALRERGGVRRLDISHQTPDFEALALLTDLEGLGFNGYAIPETGLAALTPLKKLRSLNLYDSPISDSGAALLREFSLLEELDLARTDITDATLEHVGQFMRLRRLSLEDNLITDAGLRCLAGLKGLTHLNVNETRLTEGSLDVLLTFKKLKSLGLGRLSWVKDSTVTRFAVLRDLRELDLRRSGVTRYNLKRTLKRFGKLKHVRMEGSLDESDSDEVRAFKEDMRESDYFVEMDFE
jgi:uncharacterized protein (TIGR02996 family)